MYASDYGYATSGGDKEKRTTCLNTKMPAWGSYPYCYLNNWMYNDSGMQWTITQHNTGCTVRASTFVGACNSSADYHIATPVLYLKSAIPIVGGRGTATEPYRLGTS